MLKSISFGPNVPSEGAEHRYRIPEGLQEPVTFVYWFVSVTTSAVIATRELILRLQDKNQIQKVVIPAVFQQVASQGVSYVFGPFDVTQPSSTVLNAAGVRLIYAQSIPLEVGDELFLVLTNAQVGDSLSSSFLQYEAFP